MTTFQDQYIIDFDLNPNKNALSVVSCSNNYDKYFLKLFRVGKEDVDESETIELARLPYKVKFTKDDEVVVVDESRFTCFNIVNRHFAASLTEKLTRYIQKPNNN